MMADISYIKRKIEDDIEKRIRCIKLKIGAIDFNKEIELLKYIRQQFTPEELELRVDANGGFSYHDVLVKLNQLAELNIHSIEQPIKAGLQKDMSYLCRNSLIPIALDEELIGINSYVEKKSLLTTINPQYIILKPSLHGGISGCEEWISIAEELGVGYWITSALESNIGLNSISQWCSTLNRSEERRVGKECRLRDLT